MTTSTTTDYGAVVYLNPAVKMIDNNNYRSIVAVNDINHGELLMIEHAIVADTETAVKIICCNEQIFDSYHPRMKAYADCSHTERHFAAQNKLKANTFGFENNKKMFNTMIQYTNHHCKSNAAVHVLPSVTAGETDTIDVAFMEMYSVRKIKAGDHVTISYGPETGHARDYVCDCGMELEQRKKMFGITCSVVAEMSNANRKRVGEIIEGYVDTIESKNILFANYLATLGMYINCGEIMKYDERAMPVIDGLIVSKFIKENPIEINDLSIPFKLWLYIRILRNMLFQESFNIASYEQYFQSIKVPEPINDDLIEPADDDVNELANNDVVELTDENLA
jgi:hypothetical protein